MTNKQNKYKIEDAEFGIDSRYKSKKEHELDAKSLMEARLIRIQNLTPNQIVHSKLLQLKLKMHAYLSNPKNDSDNCFSGFLQSYIDILYSKRSNFAKDINITPVSLSHVINNHREPSEAFIMRLMIHSDMMYKNVCEFHSKTWYQVYYHEKICDTMSNLEKWRRKVEKEVRISVTKPNKIM